MLTSAVWSPSTSAHQCGHLLTLQRDRRSPPTPLDAQVDIFSHIQSLRRSDIGRVDCRHHLPRCNHLPSKGVSATPQPVRGSRDSLISLMSAAAMFRSRRSAKKNARSISSGCTESSNGSTCNDVQNSGSSGLRSSVGGSRKSYPLNALFAHSSQNGSCQSSSCVAPTAAAPRVPPAGLNIRPLFDVDAALDGDTPFLGRAWLFREICEATRRVTSPSAAGWSSPARALLITGASGTGKTTLVKQLVAHSAIVSASPSELKGSVDSGIAAETPPPSGQTAADWLHAVAGRVVAVHLCQLESADSCALPFFICHIAAQLAMSPCFKSYADYLFGHADLQSMLQLDNCMTLDPVAVFRRAICEPLKLLKPPTGDALLIAVDALDEAEFHRPENGNSIGSFVVANWHELPEWLCLLVTVRTGQLAWLHQLCQRSFSLDDTAVDERVWRDAHLYVDYRFASSGALRAAAAATSGLPDGEDPQQHFGDHVVTVSRGNLLYLRLVLDLLDGGQLRLRSASYSALPATLADVFLLLFNLKFASPRAFERASPLLAVVVATLRPLDRAALRQVLCAGHLVKQPSNDRNVDELDSISDLLIARRDGSVAPFHPALRDWLIQRHDAVAKFAVDMRHGHALLAMWFGRRGRLTAHEMFDLAHHLLKAHPYKHARAGGDAAAGASSRDCQLRWLQQAAANLPDVLLSARNIAVPNIKVVVTVATKNHSRTVEVSRLLLLAGAEPSVCLSDGTPLLCRLAEAGHVELCALLLDFDAPVDARQPVGGRTALMLAAAAGQLDVAQLLHQHGADVAAQDDISWTAMAHAAACGRVAIVSFLLQCDWSATERVDADVAASSAASPPSRQLAARQSFVCAAASGKLPVCQFLLEMQEVEINCTERVSGRTALCLACENARPDVVHYLLGRGAQVAASSRATPLSSAVAGGSWEIVSALLARGLDPDAQSGADSLAPLAIAATHGHIGVIELLLSRGASVDAANSSGQTALMFAAAENHPECAVLLCDRGANVDGVDAAGRSALHHCARAGGKHTVNALLSRGAAFEGADADGMRPIDHAVDARNVSALTCFLRKGTKLSTRTWDLAQGADDVTLLLLQKLAEDGNLLYRRNRVRDASHRFSYALRKLPAAAANDGEGGEVSGRLRHVEYALHVGLARCCRRRGDFTTAVAHCADAIHVDGDAFEAFFLRAQCHFDAKDAAAARRDAERAVHLNPASRDARLLLDSLSSPNPAPPPAIDRELHPPLSRNSSFKSED